MLSSPRAAYVSGARPNQITSIPTNPTARMSVSTAIIVGLAAPPGGGQDRKDVGVGSDRRITYSDRVEAALFDFDGATSLALYRRAATVPEGPTNKPAHSPFL